MNSFRHLLFGFSHDSFVLGVKSLRTSFFLSDLHRLGLFSGFHYFLDYFHLQLRTSRFSDVSWFSFDLNRESPHRDLMHYFVH